MPAPYVFLKAGPEFFFEMPVTTRFCRQLPAEQGPNWKRYSCRTPCECVDEINK